MSQSLSAVIENLTYTGTLLSGESYTTLKVQILEYSSLSLSFNSDQNHAIYFLFSDDGQNFDISVPETFIPSSSFAGGQSYTTPGLGAWVKIRIENTSLAASTYTRLYVYGAINNIVSKSRIEGNVSIDDGDVNIISPVTTSGELITTQYNIVPGTPINFNVCEAQPLSNFSANPPTPYVADLVNYISSNDAQAQYAIAGDVLSLQLYTMPASGYSRFYSKNVTPYFAGATYVIQFTASYVNSPYIDGTTASSVQCGFGNINLATLSNAWDSGLCIGRGPSVDIDGTFYYYIYLRFFDTFGATTIYQNSFNVDVLDGSNSVENPSGMLLIPSNPNIYRLIISPSTNETTVAQIYNPSSHRFVTFHIRESPAVPSMNVYGGRFIMDQQGNILAPAPGDNIVGVNNYSVYTSYFPVYKNLVDNFTYQTNRFLASNAVEYPIFSLYQNTTFNLKLNTMVIRTKSLMVNNRTSDTAFVYIYKNNTYSPALSYTNLDILRTPLQYSNSPATPSVFGPRVKAFFVSGSSGITIDLNDIYLSPGEELLFSTQLGASVLTGTIYIGANLAQIG